MSRPDCAICRQTWGYCVCEWTPGVKFQWNGYSIVEPNVSECGRFFVDPATYYGAAYREWLLRLAQ